MRASFLSFFGPKSIAVVVASTAIFVVSNTSAADDSQKQMLKEAKVDRTHAEVIALGRVHGGGVKSSKIERTRGRLVWSFEIMMSDGRGVTEVVVDAKTGKIVSTSKAKAEDAHH